jgi:site-specific DNA recombinase
MRVVRVLGEKGESAKIGDRTQLLKLIRYCGDHRDEVDYVVVYRVDRPERNVGDHHTVKTALAGMGIRLRSVTEAFEDDSASSLMETMLAAVAQFDNDIRASRTTDGMKRALSMGGGPISRQPGTSAPTPPWVSRSNRTRLERHS